MRRTILFLVACTLAGIGLGWVFTPAHALPRCGGNNDEKVAPVECRNVREIDGTVFTATIQASSEAAQVVIELDEPRPVDTSFRLRWHRGVSSNDNVNEAFATLKAGDPGPVVMVVEMNCGQLDVKAVFTDEGDARGRVTAPFITAAHECKPSTTTTSTTTTTVVETTAPQTTVPQTTIGTTVPGQTTVPTVETTIPRELPATGGVPTWLVIIAAALIGAGLGILTARMADRGLYKKDRGR